MTSVLLAERTPQRRLVPGGEQGARVALQIQRHCRHRRKSQEQCRKLPGARFPGVSSAPRRRSGRKFLWTRTELSRSPGRAPIPTPVARFDLGEIQVNPVFLNPESIVQQLADLLRKLPIHVVGQTADAANIYEGCVSRVAGHQHGGLADCDHDVLLRLADGLGDGFGERGEQRFPFILSEDNRGFKFQ